MQLMCDKTFSLGQWILSSTGSGTYSVTNGRAVFSGAGVQLYTPFLIKPGETLKFSVMVKCTVYGAIVALDIEDKSEGVYDKIFIDVKPAFDRYEVSYTCPLTKTDGAVVLCVLGNSAYGSASTGSVFYDPQVEIVGHKISSAPLRTIAAGLLRITSTAKDIHPNFFSCGVYSISVGTTEVTVTLDHVYSTPSESFTPKRPLVFVSSTNDGIAKMVTAGTVGADANGRAFFKMKMWDAEGVVINPSTVTAGNDAYVFFEVKAP